MIELLHVHDNCKGRQQIYSRRRNVMSQFFSCTVRLCNDIKPDFGVCNDIKPDFGLCNDIKPDFGVCNDIKPDFGTDHQTLGSPSDFRVLQLHVYVNYYKRYLLSYLLYLTLRTKLEAGLMITKLNPSMDAKILSKYMQSKQ